METPPPVAGCRLDNTRIIAYPLIFFYLFLINAVTFRKLIFVLIWFHSCIISHKKDAPAGYVKKKWL